MGTIFTLGYGKLTLEEVIGILKKYEITCVIDVRGKPYSRFKPAFNQKKIRVLLPEHGVEYEHRPELSGFIEEKNEEYYRGIDFVKDTASGQNVVLFCCEADPEDCHRDYKLGSDLPVLNISGAGEIIKTRRQKALEKPVQPGLFD